MTTCSTGECDKDGYVAITTRSPAGKWGLVTTIYQIEEDAPKNATRYCMRHATDLAVGLTLLADSDEVGKHGVIHT